MSASVSLSFPGETASFFSSRIQFRAYQNAWKTLTSGRRPLPPALYAAHAVLTGGDLYKAFSPSKRPHQLETPYQALRDALNVIGTKWSSIRQASFEGLTPVQNEALQAAFVRVTDFLSEQAVTSHRFQYDVAKGQAQFKAQALAA